MGDENCQNLLLMVVSYPCRRIGVDQVVEVHQVQQQQQRPMLELVQIWRLPSSLTPSLASCTTFLPCLACTAPAGLHKSHKYNTSLFIGIFCCILQTSILPNPPLPSLLACEKSESKSEWEQEDILQLLHHIFKPFGFNASLSTICQSWKSKTFFTIRVTHSSTTPKAGAKVCLD